MLLWAIVLVALTGTSFEVRAQGELKTVLDQINALRAEPERAGELLDKYLRDAFGADADQVLKDKYDDKTSRQFLDEAIKFVESQPKMGPLQWDADLATVAAAGGNSGNRLFKPDANYDAPDTNPKKLLLWAFLRGEDFRYKSLFQPGLRFAGMAVKTDKTQITLGTLKGKAYLMKDSELANRPYDPREDKVEPWGDALNVKTPNITPFVKADGTLDVVWRDMGNPPRVFLTRYSAAGAKVFTKEVPGANPAEYQLLAGFTEDPDGNIYVLRARDEGNHDKLDQPDPPTNDKGEADPNWDRPEMMKLAKLDKDGNLIWAKNLAKKAGGAFGFVSPLSPNTSPDEGGRTPGRDSYATTSRIGFIVHKGTPLIYALYGGATEWDKKISGRHQNAYWRAVDARTGEPFDSGSAMAHSFDSQLLVTDEGVITVERSDSGLLMGNYLNTGKDELIFQFFYGTTTDGNESFTSLGSLQPASDGYLVLFAGNNTESLAGKSVSGAASKAEMLRNRNLLVMRVKKGFAQEIEEFGKDPANEKAFRQALNSMQRSEFREGLNLLGRIYLTFYDKNDSYSAGRPKMVRLADGNYIVIWERWTHNVKNGELSGSYDSTWAMKINQDGEVLKEAVRISDTARIVRGDEPVLWNGKAAFVAGDVVENRLNVYTIDGNLNFNTVALPAN